MFALVVARKLQQGTYDIKTMMRKAPGTWDCRNLKLPVVVTLLVSSEGRVRRGQQNRYVYSVQFESYIYIYIYIYFRCVVSVALPDLVTDEKLKTTERLCRLACCGG